LISEFAPEIQWREEVGTEDGVEAEGVAVEEGEGGVEMERVAVEEEGEGEEEEERVLVLVLVVVVVVAIIIIIINRSNGYRRKMVPVVVMVVVERGAVMPVRVRGWNLFHQFSVRLNLLHKFSVCLKYLGVKVCDLFLKLFL
jgi:hypothetical protein